QLPGKRWSEHITPTKLVFRITFTIPKGTHHPHRHTAVIFRQDPIHIKTQGVTIVLSEFERDGLLVFPQRRFRDGVELTARAAAGNKDGVRALDDLNALN